MSVRGRNILSLGVHHSLDTAAVLLNSLTCAGDIPIVVIKSGIAKRFAFVRSEKRHSGGVKAT